MEPVASIIIIIIIIIKNTYVHISMLYTYVHKYTSAYYINYTYMHNTYVHICILHSYIRT